ncbi:hypothetical protein GGX14DRAFT_392883 [Mycena pura]|uniref:Uncharacterized protein n=1 Tax=Mycena pura TaxID=153505 RepID=A0AAD6YH37_9AGAR|nr:hypothetical protein GGX14DRAFT_392883 [Mycena pura]
MSAPVPRRPSARARAPDAPPLVTRSGNKPHAVQGPPLIRRTREEIDADNAAAAAEAAAAAKEQEAALARVAAQEDANRREDEEGVLVCCRESKLNAVPVQERAKAARAKAGPKPVAKTTREATPAEEDDDLPPARSQHDNSPDGTEDEYQKSSSSEDDDEPAPSKKKQMKASRTDAQALRQTQDVNGTPDVEVPGKRKASGGQSTEKTFKKAKVAPVPPKKSGLVLKPKTKKKTPAPVTEEGESMFQMGGPALEDDEEHVERPRLGVVVQTSARALDHEDRQ